MFVLYNLLATTDLFPPENPMIPLKSCLSRSSPLLFRQSNWSQLHWATLSMVCPCQTNIILREKLPEKTKTLQQSCWSYCKMKVIWSLVGQPLTFMSHISFFNCLEVADHCGSHFESRNRGKAEYLEVIIVSGNRCCRRRQAIDRQSMDLYLNVRLW